MKENLKAGCGMVRRGREAGSSSFSWQEAGIIDFSGRKTGQMTTVHSNISRFCEEKLVWMFT